MAAANYINIASSGIVLETLRTDNYDNWSTLVKNYLVGQRLWHGVFEADPNKPNNSERNDDDDWRSENAKALHVIQLACGSENLSNIRKFENAREAWYHLKASFSQDVKAFPDKEQEQEQEQQDDDRNIYHLHSAVKRGNWDDAKSYIHRSPDAIFSTISSIERTILHVAVVSGHERIVQELVRIGNQRLLRMQDEGGYTALALAAELTDNTKMVESMVDKGGKELLTIKTKDDDDDDDDKGEIPVLLASAKGYKQMTKFLFYHTPIDVFFQNGSSYGVKLLTRCISEEMFDVAVLLLQDRRNRGADGVLLDQPGDLRPVLDALVHMPSAFRSGTQLGWWWQFIYNSLKLEPHIDLCGESIEIVLHAEPDEEEADANTLANLFAASPLDRIFRVVSVVLPVKHLRRPFEQCKHFVQTSILGKLPGSEKIYEMKKNHYLVLEILKQLCESVAFFDEKEMLNCSGYGAMLHAAKYGIVEFINSMRQANSDLLWAMDKNKRGIFSHAVLNRHEKVFQLIHEIEGRKEMIASQKDVFGNNMLHLAAELGPSSDLVSRSNAALQMQRELQWYMAVEKIVPLKCKEAKNVDGKKPRELFTKNHEELVKAGEKWARDTASSFTLVGTLIITIMFAAAFTVPGGNDQNTGIPMFLKKPAFTVFILADTISLITSSSSVLSFISILTSRYAEKDFLCKLPRKLLFGLITLFFSVASMMIAFVAALSMMMQGHRGVVIAAISLAVIPILVLIPTLLFLSLEILTSTIKPGLLAAKKK